MSELDALLAAGRAAAEPLFREAITVRASAEAGFDWDSGAETPGIGEVLYTGRARVKPVARSRGEEVDAGEQNTTLREYTISVPWDSPAPPGRVVPGATVDVDASPDGRLVGLRLWVTGVEYGSTATAWRISAEDRS
ncbi:DUF6093 family protein [Streptomyces lydicamycinicus]|uniref:DUF6093 family protein n=1 Tax=Streptomyces lydicamycinicus TaxID=1546107 RepID=UPI003C2C8EFF